MCIRDRLIHACKPDLLEGLSLLVPEPILALLGHLVIYEKAMNHIAAAGDASFQFLTYQLSMGRYWLPVAMTGNGEFGFDSGEGA